VKLGGLVGVIFRDGEWWGILGNVGLVVGLEQGGGGGRRRARFGHDSLLLKNRRYCSGWANIVQTKNDGLFWRRFAAGRSGGGLAGGSGSCLDAPNPAGRRRVKRTVVGLLASITARSNGAGSRRTFW